jgi:hypothetical protein
MTSQIAETIEIQCQSCGAAMSVEAHLRTTTCPYCASPSVLERPASRDRPQPELAIAFEVDKKRAETLVRGWISSRNIFARSDFKKNARIEDIKGVYLPAYLYSAVVQADYSASIGENYTETEYYTDSKGNRQSRTVTKTEWRSLSGRYATYVADIVVTASKGVQNSELERVEPFDMRTLRRYDPALLSGWIAEEPSLRPEECLQMAHEEAVGRVLSDLGKFMPGDTHRDLTFNAEITDNVAELSLVPVWVFVARYSEDRPPVRILVNGQTGKAGGDVPLSWLKITLAVAAVLGTILYFWLGRG